MRACMCVCVGGGGGAVGNPVIVSVSIGESTRCVTVSSSQEKSTTPL